MVLTDRLTWHILFMITHQRFNLRNTELFLFWNCLRQWEEKKSLLIDKRLVNWLHVDLLLLAHFILRLSILLLFDCDFVHINVLLIRIADLYVKLK